MTGIAPTSTAATRSFLIVAVLLFACAHAPVARNGNLSGRWVGTCVWTTRLPRRRVFRSNLRFAISLVHDGGEITGRGTISYANIPDARVIHFDIWGSVRGGRVQLYMSRHGSHAIGFDGSVGGVDRMSGTVYDATVMDLGGWPHKNPIELKRVGPAEVDPLYVPKGPRSARR
jgi:hypothetical protein